MVNEQIIVTDLNGVLIDVHVPEGVINPLVERNKDHSFDAAVNYEWHLEEGLRVGTLPVQIKPWTQEFLGRIKGMGRKIAIYSTCTENAIQYGLDAAGIDSQGILQYSSLEFGAVRKDEKAGMRLGEKLLENGLYAASFVDDNGVYASDTARGLNQAYGREICTAYHLINGPEASSPPGTTRIYTLREMPLELLLRQ